MLDIQDNEALVISQFCLDAKRYSDEGIARWERSSLCNWLNSEFINSSFEETARDCILQSLMGSRIDDDGKENEIFSFIFVLSEYGYNTYLPKERNVYATTYALSAKSVYTGYIEDEQSVEWWLRNAGEKFHERVCILCK